MVDNIKAAKQQWSSSTYDYIKKEWRFRPIFYVKYGWSNRFEVLPVREAVKLIGTWFPITDDLKEWLEGGKYKWVLDEYIKKRQLKHGKA